MPVDRDLFQIGARQLDCDRMKIVLEARQRRDRVEFRAANALIRQHSLRGIRLDDPRNEYSWKLGQGSTKRCRVARLDAIVQLVGQRALELLYDADHVDPRTGRGALGKEFGEFVKEREV